MKKLIIVFGLALVCFSAQAVVVCESDRQGRTCCWDTEKDGSFKPLSCM